MMTLPQAIGMRGAAVAPWTPSRLGATLWAWYDATQQGGTDGVAVSQVTDYSGNARHLTATPSSRPLYRSTSFSGSEPCFDCTGSRASHGSISATESDLAWFIAVRYKDTASGRIISHDSGSFDWTPSSVWIAAYNETAGRIYGARGNGFPLAGSFTDGTDHILACTASPLFVGIRPDGGTETSVAIPAGSLNSTTLRFGGYSTYGYCQSLIAEAFSVSGTMTEAIRQSAEGYLAHKYSLTGNLPALHPYKTTAP